MTSIQERYSELLALTKSYLQQEHALTDRILSEQESYSYFKTYAQQRQNAKTQIHTAAPVVPAQKTVNPTIHTIPHSQYKDIPKLPANPIIPSQENIEMPKSDKSDFNKAVTSPRTPNQNITHFE